MTADEIAATELRKFLNRVGHVPAVGGFAPEIIQPLANHGDIALRGAASHAREALMARARGDLDMFRTLYAAARNLLLDAERQQTDVAAARAIQTERQQADERVETERAEAQAKVEAERRLAEERVEAEREIRHRGPRAERTSTRTRAGLDAKAFELAATLRPGAYARNGRLNVAKLAKLVADEATIRPEALGEVATIEARIRREAKRRKTCLDEWID